MLRFFTGFQLSAVYDPVQTGLISLLLVPFHSLTDSYPVPTNCSLVLAHVAFTEKPVDCLLVTRQKDKRNEIRKDLTRTLDLEVITDCMRCWLLENGKVT